MIQNKFYIKPNKRRTSEIMSEYEYAAVVSIRASQIAAGSKVFTDVAGLDDPAQMARKEIADKKCPLSISRKINEDYCELWAVNELGVPAIATFEGPPNALY